MQMKKTLLFLMAILLSGGMLLQAEPVSESRAREIAKKVLAAQPATKAAVGDVKLIWNGEDAATKAAVPPAFYVFGSDRSFVIIAGDDNVQPVLAISDEHPFKVEGMPSNVKAWMDYIKGYVRSSDTRSPEIAQKWAQLTATKAMVDSTVLSNQSYTSRTVEWDQVNPANLYAPTVTVADSTQSQALCGCVALAAAEVLTWFRWPNAGTGIASSYSYPVYSVDGDYIGDFTVPEYDIEANFQLNDAEWTALSAVRTEAQFLGCTGDTRANLAKLVYACGVLIQSVFNDEIHGGTVASELLIPSAFATHMSYNSGSYADYRANHTLREWNSILKDQVLSHPVLYGGSSASYGIHAGHQYVLDGYATLGVDDVFHFNFGWGGWCNGYYYADYQNVYPKSPYNYNLQLDAILNFTPGDGTPIRHLNISQNPGMDYCGLRTNTTIEKGKNIPIEIGLIWNYAATDYDGYLKIVLEEKDGTLKEDSLFISDMNLVSSLGYYFSFSEGVVLTITKDLAFGDKLVAYFTDNDAKNHYVKLTGPRDATIVSELPVMPAAFIKTEDEYHTGDYFQFELMNNDYIYGGTVWTITPIAGGEPIVRNQADIEYKLTQGGTYKIEAAVAPKVGDAVVETITTYITVSE